MGPTLTSLGFRKVRQGTYLNELPDVQRDISFGPGYARENYWIVLAFAVRFPAVQQILNEGKKDPYFGGTYGGRADILLGYGPPDWECLHQNDLPGIAEEMLLVCKDGIEFLNRNSSMEAVRKLIVAKSPIWYGEEDEVRKLAAMDAVEGDVAAALARLDDFVSSRRSERPAVWRSAKELRDYIAQRAKVT